MPVTSQAHVVVLNAVVCQQERPVGCAACEPLITQVQLVVLNIAVW